MAVVHYAFVRFWRINQVTKLLHAAREDLEVFWHRFGQMLESMIDTQVLAASFIGRALSCEFAAQVAETLQVTLDKTESHTDWLAQSLSATWQCVIVLLLMYTGSCRCRIS